MKVGPGDTNQNNQLVIRSTGIASTSHFNQTIYEVACVSCGHRYGANGCDLWLRRCPTCGGGEAGEPLVSPMTQPRHLAEIRHTDLVFPDQSNHQGSYFGGAAMAEMDKIAFLVAARHARRPFVTASCDKLDFVAPVHVGNLIELTGQVRMVGRTSLIVDVELAAEDLTTGARHVCTRGAFTMVAADRKTNPDRLPPSPDAAPHFAPSPPAYARTLQLVFPGDTNHLGQLFGGNAMSIMGKAAYIAASRHTRFDVGMAASDKIDFIAPTREGEMLDVIAEVIKVGRTSMTVSVLAEAENLMTGERRKVGTADYVMVALDDEGRPTPAGALG